jgi:hypothetical protein
MVGVKLWRSTLCALLAELPRKKGERILRCIADQLASELTVSSIEPIRPSSLHAAEKVACRQAFAVFRQEMPALLAALDRSG